MRWILRTTRAAMMIACVGALAAAAAAQPGSDQAPPPEPQVRDPDQPTRSDRRDVPPGRGEGRRQDGSGPRGAGAPGGRGGPEDRFQPGGGRGPREMRMLDLRRMAVDLPPPPLPRMKEPPRGGSQSPFVEASAVQDQPPRDDRLIDLVRALASPLDLSVVSPAPGILMVAGAAEDHTRLKELLDQMADLFKDKYDVELLAVSFPAAQSPRLGEELTGGKVLSRCRQRVAAGVPVAMNAIDLVTYIAEWVPIVADNAVAYQPTPAQVANGLKCNLVIHPPADPDLNDSGITVKVTGEICNATIAEQTWDVAMPDAKTTLTVGLPRLAVRTIDSNVEANRSPTVVAIVPGFESAEVIAIVVKVDPAPRK